MTTFPVFGELDRAACEALLARQYVGRLAFTFRDRVDIEPIHYVYADNRLYGRTQRGTKVHVVAHHPWVAFEVDEVEAMFDWRSVVLHGRITFPDPDGTTPEQKLFARGVEVFRQLVPSAFDEGDPTPARDLLFVIDVHEMTGRSATSGRAEGTP